MQNTLVEYIGVYSDTNESIWYPMVKLGHLGLERSQSVQHALNRSNGLEMSKLLQINIYSIKLLKIVTNYNKCSKIMENPCESIQMKTR